MNEQHQLTFAFADPCYVESAPSPMLAFVESWYRQMWYVMKAYEKFVGPIR